MNRLLDWRQLKALIPYSRQHVGRLEAKGLFPKRKWLSANRVAWDSGAVQEWLDSRQPGGPPQKPDLGPKRAAPEPSINPHPDAMRRLQELLAEQRELMARLGFEAAPAVKKPERKGRSRSSP
jgi:prophage regulatory protein